MQVYNQIPGEHSDIPKTTITTSFGLYEFLRVPVGFKNVVQTLQRFVNHVLHGLYFRFV